MMRYIGLKSVEMVDWESDWIVSWTGTVEVNLKIIF